MEESLAGSPTFEEFVAARSVALLRTSYALTGDYQRAEDLLQTALVACLGKWGRITDHEAYVRQAVLRTFLTGRRRRWSAEIPAAHVPDAPIDSDFTETVDSRQDLLQGLNRLPPRQRAVIVL